MKLLSSPSSSRETRGRQTGLANVIDYLDLTRAKQRTCPVVLININDLLVTAQV